MIILGGYYYERKRSYFKHIPEDFLIQPLSYHGLRKRIITTLYACALMSARRMNWTDWKNAQNYPSL